MCERGMDTYAETVGERLEAGERKEESSQCTRNNAEPTVHGNNVKCLNAMLLYVV